MSNLFLPFLFLFYDSSNTIVDWEVYAPADGDCLNHIKDVALRSCRFHGYDAVAIFHSKTPGDPLDLFVTELDSDG